MNLSCGVEGGTEDGVALHVQAPSKAQKGVHRQQAVTSARPVRRRGADGDLWEENKLFILSCWLNSRLHKRMCHAGLLMSFSACCVICATWVWTTVCWVWVGVTHGWRLAVQIPTDTRRHSDTEAIESTNSVKASLSNLFEYTCILALSVTSRCGPSRGQTVASTMTFYIRVQCHLQNFDNVIVSKPQASSSSSELSVYNTEFSPREKLWCRLVFSVRTWYFLCSSCLE